MTLSTTPLSSDDFKKNCMNSTSVTIEAIQGATATTMANATGDSDRVSSGSGSSSAASTIKAADWTFAAVIGAAGLALL